MGNSVGYPLQIVGHGLFLLAIAALFAWLLVAPRREAEEHLRAEREGLSAIRLVAAGAMEPGSPGPYLFEWLRGGTLPALLVGRPQEGAGGHRWFATADGREVYQFDTIQSAAPKDSPDVASLRRWLGRQADGKSDRPLPHGWQRCEGG